ncbi:hypothetical protein NC652_035878 [Populus alba x Populus x berolinensis]|nr:hypothetical protein NC652_035878 [Populus alba x Populus x berolinensis]
MQVLVFPQQFQCEGNSFASYMPLEVVSVPDELITDDAETFNPVGRLFIGLSDNLWSKVEEERAYCIMSIVLKPGPARRVDPGPGRPGTRPTRARDRSGWRPKPAWELARSNPINPTVYKLHRREIVSKTESSKQCLKIINIFWNPCRSYSPPPEKSLPSATRQRTSLAYSAIIELRLACSSLGVLQLGKCIHKEVLVVGFEGFSSIRIGVIELYSSCGVMEDAEKVFDEMYQRDVIVWNLMIRGFSQSLRDSEALGLFHDMLDWGFKPDEATVVTVLPICARSGFVDVGKWIHSYEDNVF